MLKDILESMHNQFDTVHAKFWQFKYALPITAAIALAVSQAFPVAVPLGRAEEKVPEAVVASPVGFLRGVGYSPWHSKLKRWIGTDDVEEFEKDMDLMRNLHINAVRTWGPITPQKLARFRREGLKSLPQIAQLSGPPSQFADGSPAGLSFCAPDALEAMHRNGANLAESLAGDASVAGILLGNEYSWIGRIGDTRVYSGFDEATVRAYHRWISRRFGSVENWNRLTGRRDASISEVKPPGGVLPRNDFWEWWLFNRRAFADFLKSGYEGVRSIDLKTPVSYALLCGNRWDAATEDAALDFLDVQGDNLYWGWDKDWAAYGVRLTRRIGIGRPILVTEFGFATCEADMSPAWQEAAQKPEGELTEPSRAARLMTQNLWFLALHPEVRGVFPFVFNDEWWHGGDRDRLDAPGDCFGLVTADRQQIKQVGLAVGACYAEFEKIDSFLASRQAPVELLITDQAGDWWRKSAARPDLSAIARELYRRGVVFQLVSLLNPEDLDRSSCRRLLLADSVIPDNPDQSSPAMEALGRFKARGGRILSIAPEPFSSLYGTKYAPEDLAARIVPPPPAGGLWAALEDFLPARKTTVTSDRQVFWRAFTANGIPHLLVVVDGDQPAASVQIQGFPADTLIAGDARSFAKNEEGCVLTDITTHALIKGRP